MMAPWDYLIVTASNDRQAGPRTRRGCMGRMPAVKRGFSPIGPRNGYGESYTIVEAKSSDSAE